MWEDRCPGLVPGFELYDEEVRLKGATKPLSWCLISSSLDAIGKVERCFVLTRVMHWYPSLLVKNENPNFVFDATLLRP